METLVIVFFGFLFGALMQYARVNRYDVISGIAVLEDFTVAKVMALAIGLGAILVNLEIELGLAAFHVKPIVMGGLIWGGLVFGAGMAILGYCPGTLAISLGQGALDALFGILGGLAGGLAFTLVQPALQPALGPNLGAISLYSNIGEYNAVFHLFTLAFGALVIWLAFAVHRREGGSDRRWMVTGVGLALLNAVVMLDTTAARPVGASTSYPYLADVMAAVTDNDYFRAIQVPGHWELIFLFGSFLAGLVFALWRKDFELRLIYPLWEKYKGTKSTRRIAWSVAGGFLLIFGARMAGGCTSGHILSGGMQLAKSSLIFAAFVFISLILTGKLFYSPGRARSENDKPIGPEP